MSLSTTETIRKSNNNLSTTIDDGFIDDMLINAESKLREWIVDQYDWADSILKNEETAESQDVLTAKRLRNAESNLLMYYAVQSANTVVTSNGVVMSSVSKEFGDGNFTVASPTQIEQIKTGYFETAQDLAAGGDNGVSGVHAAAPRE